MKLISARHRSETRSYLDLNARAIRALVAADFRKAAKLFEWAYVEARRIDDPILLERAYCNLAVPAIESGSVEPHLARLRDISARSSDAGSRFLASYTLASAFRGKMPRKARFYAELAHQNARQLNRPHELAISKHKLGVLLCLEAGQLQDAQRHLEDALELGEASCPPNALALIQSNLGFCLDRMEQPTRALSLLQESADELSAMGCPLYEDPARLNLGFSLVEMEEFEMALDQANLVLDSDRGDYRKHALYLAGEASSYLDRPHLAKDYFTLLQQEFYPDLPSLLDTLLSVRTHRLVNWFA